MKILDFQRNSANIRNNLNEKRKLLLYFLINQKKRVTFIRYSWNSHVIFPYPKFPLHYFGIFPRTSLGIFSEYAGNISTECSTNSPRTYIYTVSNGLVRKVTTFVKSSMFDVWRGSISLQLLKNLKLNRLMNIEYQLKSNTVREVYALFINMDHKYGQEDFTWQEIWRDMTLVGMTI